MKDKNRLTRMSVITGTVVAVVALAVVLVTLFIASPARLDGVATQAGETAAEETQACAYPKEWVGKQADEKAVKAFAKSYRILGPNTPATMDYRHDRINVRTDEDGIVLDVTCG